MFCYGDRPRLSLKDKTGVAREMTWQKYIPLWAWSDWASEHHHLGVAELLVDACPPAEYIPTSPPPYFVDSDASSLLSSFGEFEDADGLGTVRGTTHEDWITDSST